ncbi:hypothetical protein GWK08_07330 [Leptobacterium flavescens]|uniref:Uncharacterized protein n=1 Tax=Leptobacterium flavescens TaxID=472055 RepID=A0A6P0US98_9FLAO|nr:hypothetical protein [Leptobacterium flavescens]NER13246.1 hypothetical protein [Leptobacterium flavescens]
MILDVFKHKLFFSFFKYIRFTGLSDKEHLLITFNLLKNRFVKKEGVIREFNILNFKSDAYCDKCYAYFIASIDISKRYGVDLEKNIGNVDLKKEILNQNELFNFCQIYFSSKKNKSFHWIAQELEEQIKAYHSKIEVTSLHIKLLKSRFDFHSGALTKKELESKVMKYLEDKDLRELMKNNSFSPEKQSTSHELGYLLNILMDIFEETKSKHVFLILESYLEKLHLIFVRHKVFYSTVYRKADRINISGIFLISKVFLRYTLLIKDFRYASAAFFLIDIGKYLQLKNHKKMISNTFPVYKYGSPFKYPAWTLFYFVEVLDLKISAKNLLKNETGVRI